MSKKLQLISVKSRHIHSTGNFKRIGVTENKDKYDKFDPILHAVHMSTGHANQQWTCVGKLSQNEPVLPSLQKKNENVSRVATTGSIVDDETINLGWNVSLKVIVER